MKNRSIHYDNKITRLLLCQGFHCYIQTQSKRREFATLYYDNNTRDFKGWFLSLENLKILTMYQQNIYAILCVFVTWSGEIYDEDTMRIVESIVIFQCNNKMFLRYLYKRIHISKVGHIIVLKCNWNMPGFLLLQQQQQQRQATKIKGKRVWQSLWSWINEHNMTSNGVSCDHIW